MILPYKKRFLWPLLVGTFGMMVLMYITGKPLKTPSTCLGIVNLEFASSGEKVDLVISAWKAASNASVDPVKAAKLNTGLDFIFLLFYSLFLSTLCWYLSLFFKPGKITWTLLRFFSHAALAAGALDVLENIGMLVSLAGSRSDVIALTTAICAALKFLILATMVVWIGATLLRRRRSSQPPH